MKKETIIISLGGSLVAPGEIDIGFLKNFRHCLKKYLDKKRFFVFVGGGKVARNYQKALLEFGTSDAERDWIGINVSRLNSEIVKKLFGKNAYSKIITNPTKKINAKNNVVVAAGFKPGWSTDYCSVLSAKANKINTIINLTNIDYVYDKDPNKFSDARPIRKINWKDFRKIVGNKWMPGMSLPFDPRASKIAQQLKLKVAIINGKNLDRLEDFLNNKQFIGTLIHPVK